MMYSIFWFRRDLRLHDNTGLYHALCSENKVIPFFLFDRHILNKLDRDDKRVEFIHQRLKSLKQELKEIGSDLLVLYDTPENAWNKLLADYPVSNVYINHDYEPYAIERDDVIKKLLEEKGVSMHTYKDQVIFEKDEVLSDAGKTYTVYTPYSRKWLTLFAEKEPYILNTNSHFGHFAQGINYKLPGLGSMGFKDDASTKFPSSKIQKEVLKDYDKTRDYPFLDSTSRLSIHLRFGTISIRSLIKETLHINLQFLKELIWREFFMQIIWHYPNVVTKCFKPAYEKIAWVNNENEFKKWCFGQTGYPIVDAGMRELNQTGYMHNRVRMITASFLTKHLLVDWRWGEAYFAKKLLDYDLAINNGNWQWVAGTGCDAAPYFRIFNPTEQVKKFDNQQAYIRKWVPELDEANYPQPIIDHRFARERALRVYKEATTTL